MSVPFAEQGGRLRGVLDVVSGRYPRFVFGGSVGRLLPVFHFHDERADDLEPKLRYLAENGYRSVRCDDIAAYISGGTLPDRAVALCFDDAWASVWTIAAPFLQHFSLTAIVYAIPGRTDDAPATRPQLPPAAPSSAQVGSPFMTWPELQALHATGVADVQSHTFSHAMIGASATAVDFVKPGFESTPYLNRPLADAAPPPDAAKPGPFTTPDDLGAPLYASRSRMSDAPRVRHSPTVRDACMRVVHAEGGPAFFSKPEWRARLQAVASEGDSPFAEAPDVQQRTIERELDSARSVLNDRLRTQSVNHVCLPWGIAGSVTNAAIRRLGFATAVANRLPGVFGVRPGDDPLWLKRLPNRYIFRLPGEGRRWWFVAPR